MIATGARVTDHGRLLDEAQACARAERLRRMQWLATSLLCVMLVMLAVSAAYQTRYPLLQWIRAFTEAGVVGAMADWYAVTALFRHPLGLPFPHTAIIPGNKDRIGESLGDFVEHNFLTPENITEKLRQYDAATSFARWLAARSSRLAVAAAVVDALPAVLNGLEDKDVRRFLDRALTPQLLGLDLSRIASQLLTVLTERGRHQALLDRALQALERWLVAKQSLIEAKFSEASPYTPGLVDSYVVKKFLQGIIALLHEVVGNPGHELRGQFDRAVRTLIQNLASSEEYRQKGQALMSDVIEHLRSEGFYRSLWEDIRVRIEADLEGGSSSIKEHIAGALAALAEGLLREPDARAKLNGWWLDTVHYTVVRFKHEMSRLITDVVKSWNAEQVSRKVELEIGRDLQYIRINGTLVGGAVGVLLHAGIRFV